MFIVKQVFRNVFLLSRNTRYSLYNLARRKFADDERKYTEFGRDSEKNQEEINEDFDDDDEKDPEDPDVPQLMPFTSAITSKHTPQSALEKLRYENFQEITEVILTLHLTADYAKRDQKVKGVFFPEKRLNINYGLGVVTKEENRHIVEQNAASFLDQSSLRQIISGKLTFDKYIFTSDSLNVIDKKLRGVLMKNNNFPEKSTFTLCNTPEELREALENFAKGMI
jgi:hypothetical protein